jgi:hypothetical protein
MEGGRGHDRRQLLRIFTISGVATALVLPASWTRPLVKSVIVPAHAQASPRGAGVDSGGGGDEGGQGTTTTHGPPTTDENDGGGTTPDPTTPEPTTLEPTTPNPDA